MSRRLESRAPDAVRIVHVVGARPQFIKLAPVCRAIAAANVRGNRIESLIIHTGQHYDPSMSDVFFEELDIPLADVHLGVGSGSHGQQTGHMLEKLEVALQGQQPDIVLTYGDTNSTLAATLAAAKLQMPLAHVEAGLRSFNRRMPEETNRVVADHLSDLLFAPTPAAVRNLATEGLTARVCLTGDVMLDAIRYYETRARANSNVLERLGLTRDGYLVATLHRAANTEGGRLRSLLEALNSVARADRPVVFPVHPRTAKSIREAHLSLPQTEGLRVLEPLGYLDMIRLVGSARIVLTDSGGLQKEAFFLGRPCITLRDETEWIETVTEGGNIVAGTEPHKILDALRQWDHTLAAGPFDLSAAVERVFGVGEASAQIITRTTEFLASRVPS